MASWSGKSRGGKAGYAFFIFLTKTTHIRVIYFFVYFVALYFYFFSEKQPIQFYFRKVLGYTNKKSAKAIFRNYLLLGQSLVDKMIVMAGVRSRFTFDFNGETHLRAMVKEGKGGLLVGAHMGNWEVAGELLDRLDTKINIVLLDAEHEQIKALFEEKLNHTGTNLIPIKEDFSHLFRIKEAFDRNELVVMHGDRFLPGTNTLEMDFMNKKAHFPTGPLYLASKHQVPVSFVYALKESVTHYSFFATEPKTYLYPSNLKLRKEKMALMMNDYISSLESIIKQYPLQWFNYYPFWEEEKNN